MPPWQARSDSLHISVRLRPGASNDGIDGRLRLSSGATVLSVRVRAVAESGRANTALERLLADALDLPRSAVSVVGGHKSRLKQVRATGDPAALVDTAARLWPSLDGEKGAEQ